MIDHPGSSDKPGNPGAAFPPDVAGKLSEAALEKALLDAHANGNRRALAMLYEAAADRLAARAKSDPEVGSQEPPDRISDAEAFFLVQAYVFALQAGIDRAQVLKSRLIAAGRDA